MGRTLARPSPPAPPPVTERDPPPAVSAPPPPAPAPDRERAVRAIKVLLFSASLVPAAVGGAIAHAAGSFAWPPFLLAAVGLFLGQAGGDYLYFHARRSPADADDAPGRRRMLLHLVQHAQPLQEIRALEAADLSQGQRPIRR